jgi:hypothetical protein
MAVLNPYLAYKRDTSRLVYWIVKTSNTIITTSPALSDEFDAPRALNTDGRITVAGLVSLSKLIAKHINSVPHAILGLFKSVIQARTSQFEAYSQLVVKQSDPDIERSNASHKHFIDALSEAFNALGGTEWDEKQRAGPASTDPISDQHDLDQLLFANRFATLNVDDESDRENEDQSDTEHNVEIQPNLPSRKRRQRKALAKGKQAKERKGATKKTNNQRQQPPLPEGRSPESIAIESYGIIQDKQSIKTEYFMAVHSLAAEWADLREYIQGVWRDVAYDGLNSAVAGALSKMAVNMIERSAAAMFVDFPDGYDSFETVINTCTRGNRDINFKIRIMVYGGDTAPFLIPATAINITEQLMIHAYQDLLDFVEDFQKNGTGKPTKRMLKELNKWDPSLDLQQSSDSERLQWRRCYTINWLYDLVNVFSSLVVQRKVIHGKQHESVDWTTATSWGNGRCLYGLGEFASFVTQLAMQKPPSDIRHKVLPHHVFQLQCIVDSFATSRGWTVNGLNGHILMKPAHEFRSRRDIDRFLDRDHKRPLAGILLGTDLLNRYYRQDDILHDDPSRNEAVEAMLDSLKADYLHCLRESKDMRGSSIPPSRFSATNPNGLWEYSPFLCGAGLAEALVDAYRYSMIALDQFPEAILLVHLHNMLVQTGRIPRPVTGTLYTAFEELFLIAFYPECKVPTTNFGAALQARVVEASPRRSAPRHSGRGTLDDVMRLSTTRFFKNKSFLLACEVAGWNIDRVPDSDLNLESFLVRYRICETKHTVDPVTGLRRMEDTALVNRMRARGYSDEYLASGRLFQSSRCNADQRLREALKKAGSRAGYIAVDSVKTTSIQSHAYLTGRDLLHLVRRDIYEDVCGMVPLSALNYMGAMAWCIHQLGRMEIELDKIPNPLYMHVYGTRQKSRKQKRFDLVRLAVHGQDEECLRVMARELQDDRSGLHNFLYWGLDTSPLLEKIEKDGWRSNGPCTVM